MNTATIFITLFIGLFLLSPVQAKKTPVAAVKNKANKSTVTRTARQKPAKAKKRSKPARSAKKSGKKLASYEGEKPIIIQRIISHSRNTDQVSFIFREDRVDVNTNTTSLQDGTPRLGQFSSRYTKQLTELRKQVSEYYRVWTSTVPASSAISNNSLIRQRAMHPHAPILIFAGEQMPNNHPYSTPLSKIFYSIWENQWVCIKCAFYKERKNSIVRIIQTSDLPAPGGKSLNVQKTRKVFKKDQLNCLPKGHKIECVDPEFGIFDM